MEIAKLDWKTFTARRRLDKKAWIISKGFKNYNDLKKWCENKGMVPPTKDEVVEYFKKPKKKDDLKAEKTKAVEPLVKKEEMPIEKSIVKDKAPIELESAEKEKPKKRGRKKIAIDDSKEK